MLNKFFPSEHGFEDEEIRLSIELLDAFGECTCVLAGVLIIC